MNRSSAALAAVIVVLLVAGVAVLAQDAAQVAAPETTPAPGADAPTDRSVPPATDPAPATEPDGSTERSISPAPDPAPATGPDPASEGPDAAPGSVALPDAASDPRPGSEPQPDTGSDVALTTPDQGDDALPHTGGAPVGLGAALLTAALAAAACRVGLRPLRDG